MAETFRQGAELLLQVYPEPPQADKAEWTPPTSSKVGWKGLSAAQLREAASEQDRALAFITAQSRNKLCL